MIVKSFEIQKLKDKKNIFLIYGDNQGLKEEIIQIITQGFAKENVIKHTEKEILTNLDLLYNSLYTKSFFDQERVILIDNISEKIKTEIEKILEKKINDILILISQNLEKKSKLRNLFEKEKNLVCIPVYKDDSKTLLAIANSFFREKKINISAECLNIIVERSSEDRKNLQNELKKIEMFIGDKKKIELNDLIQLTNLSENYSINRIVDHCLAKNSRLTLKALNENIFSQEENMIIIRSFLSKAKRLLKLVEDFEKTQNIDVTLSNAKPPVFWKDKDITKKQIKIWTKNKLELLIKNINHIEVIVKKNAEISKSIIQDFIIELSTKANN